MKNVDALILGAGPAGLAAAFELDRSRTPFTLVEKRDAVGGISRTLLHKDFRTDIGPHRFYSENQYLYDMIEDLLGEHWVSGERLSRFYIKGKLYDFPKIRKGLLVAGPFVTARIGLDYLWQRIKGPFTKRPATFEEAVISSFGNTLAGLFVLDFTEKFWGLPCSEILPDWARERMFDISVGRIVKKILSSRRVDSRNLANRFYYPDTGIGLVYDSMLEHIKNNGEVLLNSRPVLVEHDGRRIARVDVEEEGRKSSFCPGSVLSSVPITEFLKMMEPRPPAAVLEAADHLQFRSHVSLFITLDKERVFPDNWLYFPDREVPFARVMEPKNFSSKMAPEGKTSLLVEYFCRYGDTVWNAGDYDLFELTVPWLERMGFIKRDEVIDYVIVDRERYAYPIFDLEYHRWRGIVKAYLDGFENLQLIGRGGGFLYNNMDTAMETGILAARNVIEGKRYDIDDTGSGREYFKKGYNRRA